LDPALQGKRSKTTQEGCECRLEKTSGAHRSTPAAQQRAAQRSEMRRLLEVEIDALPDDYRVVFVLRAVEELSVEETAEALGIPQATVRTRLFRARSLLREALASKIDLACEEAFSFAGERCDRIVAHVLERMK
jgi:RNA polymerase sigma-70 factor (ECF subfamily)